MKKVLLIVAMLLSVSSVMAADVTITATVESINTLPDGNYQATVRVNYSSAIDIRAFALDINVDGGCTFANIRDFNVGENTGVKNGYGIFPSRFRSFINAAAPAWGDANSNSNYNPTPAWAEPGSTNTGMGFNKFIVEMGYLGAGDSNKPALTGTLFRVDVNSYAHRCPTDLQIVADTMRGGVVAKDTNATTTSTNLPYITQIGFSCGCTTIPAILGDTLTDANTAILAAGLTVGTITYEPNSSYAVNHVCRQDNGCVAPGTAVNYVVALASCVTPVAEVGNAKAVAEAAWTGQGFTLCGTPVSQCPAGVILTQESTCLTLPHCIVYTYSVAPAVPNVVNMTRANAVIALTSAGFVVGPTATDVCGFGGTTPVGSVYATNPAAGATPGCGATVVLSIAMYPIKSSAPNSMYANWVTNNKPACWAFPRQCHGDADGKKAGSNWVTAADLTIYKSAVNKNPLPLGGTCADFDHKKAGSNWVTAADLTIYKAYVNKGEALNPVCGVGGVSDVNFWYLCMPTGGTCPTGVTCATIGQCPNTP